MTGNSPFCPFCRVEMYPIEDEDAPTLPTWACCRCGFHPNSVLMEDEGLYRAYQAFYFRFQPFLMPEIRRMVTGGKSTLVLRRRTRAPSEVQGNAPSLPVIAPCLTFNRKPRSFNAGVGYGLQGSLVGQTSSPAGRRQTGVRPRRLLPFAAPARLTCQGGRETNP